ncbi:hypothetical protein AB0D49_08140 [Streptomyces sp. NPDC048290]|uniref:hypothetical protein n=1 Tax=Streptomyces sp. NPDC048290 TaxID=3155811 RepID=UPI0034330204
MPIPGNLLSSTTESIDPNTSGWLARLNSTLAKGVGGRNGDGCLVVKSVAAGETQAITLSSYTVTPGTVYYAFADAAGVVPERIGIRWKNWRNTEIAVTWSVTTMGSSPNWHRVSVAGAAPAGSMFAQVVLSSTEVGAAVNHYWENVYLGLPIRTTGNLLPFGTESTEIDASGWTPVVNATVSRQVPVLNWSVTNYLAGGHTLAMTAIAAGNAAVLSVDRPTVTAGAEYLAYCYLQPPVLSATAWIELRFYDVNGNQLAATRSTLAPPDTGIYRQRVSATAPAAAATCGFAAGLDGAGAGQILRLETVAIIAAPDLIAGNVLPYASASFEQGLAGWSVVSGPATAARSAPWGADAFDGAYSLTLSSSTAAASTIRSGRFPVAAGVNWRAQAYVHPDAGAWSGVRVRVRWYDAENTDLGASTGTSYTLPGTAWYALPSDAVAPVEATQGAVEVVATASATNSVLNVDAVALWQVLPLIAVAADSDASYVTLTLRELTPGQLVSVYRIVADGSRTLVRGPGGLLDRVPTASDLMIIEDHEAPIGAPFSYRVQIREGDGTLVSDRSSEAVALTLADTSEAWLKDPGNPQRNLRVLIGKAPDWQRPIEQAAYVVRGRRNKVVLSGVRQGLEGDLAIWTRSDDERQALHLLLGSGNTLLWQSVPGMGVSDMYVNIAQITEARLPTTARESWRAWTLPLTEADMPTTTGVNGPAGRTWQDVLTEFAIWDDVLSTYATWEDVLLDRRG